WIHDPVTLFGDQFDLVDRADGLHPQPKHRRAVFMADLDQLFDMAAELGVRAVDGLALFARKLDLAARFDSDRGALALKADHAAAFLVRLVAVALGQPAQNLFDTARARIRERAPVVSRDRYFFVLGSDPPLIARLRSAFEI